MSCQAAESSPPKLTTERLRRCRQVIDYGFPQSSSSEALKEFVLNDPIIVRGPVSCTPRVSRSSGYALMSFMRSVLSCSMLVSVMLYDPRIVRGLASCTTSCVVLCRSQVGQLQHNALRETRQLR